MVNNMQTEITFHENETSTNTGKELNNSGIYSTVFVEILSTGIFTVQFEVKGKSGDWKKISGVNTDTIDLASVTSDKSAFWEVSLIGYSGFRVNLTSNTGTTTIYGRVVG